MKPLNEIESAQVFRLIDVPLSDDDDSVCWIWLGESDLTIFLPGKRYDARQIVVLYTDHELPPPGKIVVTCGNPACVSPDHMVFVEDVRTFGPHNAPNLKLAKSDVEQIRAMYPGHSMNEIARQFGISRQHVSRIVNYRSWPS
jgi:AraC-like DNA-binding protein